MDIAVIGTGYVGLCSGAGFAEKGHKVTCVGRNPEKIDKINTHIPPLYEEGLEDLLKRRVPDWLQATNDMTAAVTKAPVIFVCVGTPSGDDGRIDLTQMKTVARQLGEIFKTMTDYKVVVVKSTVVPGTTEHVMAIIEEVSGKKAGQDFGMCMNPEFLREGKALEDFLKPDRIVIGELDAKSGDLVAQLYDAFDAPILRTPLKTAEMIKYASNSLLATKISFTNEVGNLCKILGIDVYDVMKGVGLDHRISPQFLEAGIGFGGSCFPKDVSALKSLAEDSGSDAQLLSSVLDINKRQRHRIVTQLETALASIQGKTIALLGLAFKPGTDDIREAPALDIIHTLIEKGASVRAYDPQAMDNVKRVFPDITYCTDAKEALKGSDACLLLTDWDEFKQLTNEDFATLTSKVVLEGRKILDPSAATFDGVCW